MIFCAYFCPCCLERGQGLGTLVVILFLSFIHSFCVLLRLSNYNIVCSVVMSLSLLLEKVFFSSLVLSHPLAICTTVTFYIVLHYSNNSFGEVMHLQVLHT